MTNKKPTNPITIIRSNYQTGSFYHGTIMVNDEKVGICRLGCSSPSVDLIWDENEGQPLISTRIPELQKQDMNELHIWLGKKIIAGKIPVHVQ
jgi:hypothetical protein